ncbi:hypothetical protein F5884DRAFT_788767 [Xylogone sp. PMI_703]|nr:hypothetical protein F5884DRAFT_788767 [Xylogone sp. PMI_703]
MQLCDLPVEVLCLLPNFVSNIEDYMNAASACRTLREAFGTVKPNTILRLAANSSPTFFSPHPYFLVMATARQVAEWAIGDETRILRLHQALQGGFEGLLDLCIEKAELTMEDIRRLHLARFSILNPLVDKIDKMAGDQWCATPNFWTGGVSEPITVDCEANRAAFQIIIYGELFAGTMKSYLEPEKKLPRFDLNTRLEFIKYCIPDWRCLYSEIVLRTGPYTEDKHYSIEDQLAAQYVLSCSRWKRLWQPVMDQIGPPFEEDWRQQLWWSAVQSLGLEGMELVTTEAVLAEKTGYSLSEQWRSRLTEIRNQIQALDDEPGYRRTLIVPSETQDVLFVFEFPDLDEDIQACMEIFEKAERRRVRSYTNP